MLFIPTWTIVWFYTSFWRIPYSYSHQRGELILTVIIILHDICFIWFVCNPRKSEYILIVSFDSWLLVFHPEFSVFSARSSTSFTCWNYWSTPRDLQFPFDRTNKRSEPLTIVTDKRHTSIDRIQRIFGLHLVVFSLAYWVHCTAVRIWSVEASVMIHTAFKTCEISVTSLDCLFTCAPGERVILMFAYRYITNGICNGDEMSIT